jgi:hypothetical protein
MDISLRNRPWGKALAGVLLLVLGLACLAFVIVNLTKDASLWIWGQRTTAEVVDWWAEQTSESGASEAAFQYFIRYQFTTSDGQVITKTSSVSAIEWVGLGQGSVSGGGASVGGGEVRPAAGVYQEQAQVPPSTTGGLEEGSPVAVVYFPPYPTHNRLDESRFIPVLACAYVPLVVSWA